MNARWQSVLLGLGGGFLYGLISYFIFQYNGSVMLLSFLIGVPFVVGVVCALLTSQPFSFSITNAVIAITLIALTTLIFQFEAIICWIILAPIAYAMALLGVSLVYAFRRFWAKPSVLFGLVLLPFITLPLEKHSTSPTSYHVTSNSLVIEANAATVWEAIKSVPAIEAREYKAGWSHRLGLPRPISATLEGQGVGAVRRATFSSGLVFLERINSWQVNESLAFVIEAQGTGSERAAFALGPEMGGPLIDVLSGRYVIEPLSDTRVILYLSSTQRVSSNLNAYALWWVNAIMGDLQRSILEVIKQRCEVPVS